MDGVEKNLWINRVIHSMGIKSAKSLWTTVDNKGEKRRNIVGKPVNTFCARVKTGWVNIKVGSVIKFITACAHVLGISFIPLAGEAEKAGEGEG